ncbi:hypothetical protein BH10PLA1_BH10PLA1_11470 [soil metagenome]
MRQWILAAVFATVSVIGCDKTPPAPQAKKAMPDLSLPAPAYVKQGLPEIDHPWSVDELETALTTIRKMGSINGQCLPRYQSPASGQVFARMISEENYASLADTAKPIDDRLPAAMNYLNTSGQILKLYFTAFRRDQVTPDEMIELVGSNLRACVMVLGRVDEFLPTLKTSDGRYQVRMNGLAKLKAGLAEVAGGAIMSLTERQSYPLAARQRLIVHLSENLPTIVAHLSDDAKAQVLRQLDVLADNASNADMQPALGKLRDDVTAAAAKK